MQITVATCIFKAPITQSDFEPVNSEDVSPVNTTKLKLLLYSDFLTQYRSFIIFIYFYLLETKTKLISKLRSVLIHKVLCKSNAKFATSIVSNYTSFQIGHSILT